MRSTTTFYILINILLMLSLSMECVGYAYGHKELIGISLAACWIAIIIMLIEIKKLNKYI